MRLLPRLVNGAIKGITRLLCRVDDAQLARIPARGPLILVGNHINFVEVPLIVTHLFPRPITGFAKMETWENPLLAQLFNMWEAIPIRRGEVDLAAMRQAVAALKRGKILGIAPEGTRSGNGKLGRGHPGVVTLALLSGAPLMPIIYFGGEHLYSNLRRLKRTDFHIIVGQPFTIETNGQQVNSNIRQDITDEIMYQLAALLPPENRGVYSDLSAATTRYLKSYRSV